MSFLLLLSYLTVVYLRPADWIPALAGWQLLDLAMLGTGFFLAMRLALTKVGDVVRLPHNRIMLLFFAAVVASHLFNLYFGGAARAFRIFLVNAVTYFLIVNIVNTERKVRVILLTLVLLTVALAVQGIQQFHAGTGWAGQPLAMGGRITWVGIFDDPNDLALAFVMVVPILLAYLTARAFSGFKLLSVLLLGVLMYATYLTNSRGGALALVVGVGFFFLKRMRQRLLGLLLGGAAATAVFLSGPSRLGILSVQEESAAGRLDAWYYGFQLLKRNPLFGAGQDMFTNSYPLTAHNSFVLAFAELGLVGFFCWVGMLYVAYRSLSLAQQQRGGLAPHSYGLQGALIGFCAAAFFLSRTYIMMPYLLVALSAAVSNVVGRRHPELAFRFTRKDWWNIGKLCLGLLMLLQICMKVWR